MKKIWVIDKKNFKEVKVEETLPTAHFSINHLPKHMIDN